MNGVVRNSHQPINNQTPDVLLLRSESYAGVSVMLGPDPAVFRVIQASDERSMSSIISKKHLAVSYGWNSDAAVDRAIR